MVSARIAKARNPPQPRAQRINHRFAQAAEGHGKSDRSRRRRESTPLDWKTFSASHRLENPFFIDVPMVHSHHQCGLSSQSYSGSTTCKHACTLWAEQTNPFGYSNAFSATLRLKPRKSCGPYGCSVDSIGLMRCDISVRMMSAITGAASVGKFLCFSSTR